MRIQNFFHRICLPRIVHFDWGSYLPVVSVEMQHLFDMLIPPLQEFSSLPSAKCFAECNFSSTRQRASMPSVMQKTLGKEHLCLNTRQRSSLPSVILLGTSVSFGTRQRSSLPSVFLALGKKIIFFIFYLSNFFFSPC